MIISTENLLNVISILIASYVVSSLKFLPVHLSILLKAAGNAMLVNQPVNIKLSYKNLVV